MARTKKEAGDRREEILTATLELISERGIGKLRGADVAERLGVSSALVFYHFESLAKLVISAFRFATNRDLTRLDEILEAADTPTRQRLTTALAEYGPTGAAQSWRLWIEGWSSGLRDPELREVMRELDQRWRQVVTELISAGARAGEFHTQDPRGAAWRLTAMLDGFAVQRVVFGEAVRQSEVDKWLNTALTAELGGP